MKKILLNDTSRISEYVIGDAYDDITSIISSGRWLLGDYNEKFADVFSSYIGVDYCLPVANGTDALELALKCIVEPGKSEVITVANAGGYTSTACYLSNLKPIYIDVLEDSLLVNINKIGELVNAKTACVVVTHLYGRAVDVDALRTVLKKVGYPELPIIEDCAQAHGASIGNRKVGSLGDLATFSFYPTKNLGTVGDAGAITTNKRAYYYKLKQLSQYGWSSKYSISLRGGRNSRMDEIQAAILCRLIKKLDGWNKKRRDIYSQYISSNTGGLSFYERLDGSNVVHLAVLRTKKRDEFIRYMNSNGVSVDIHYPILDFNQIAWGGDSNVKLPISEKVVEQIVTLPCFPTMTNDEINHVCKLLRGWCDE